MSQKKGAFGLELQMFVLKPLIPGQIQRSFLLWMMTYMYTCTGTWQDSLGDLEPQYELQTTIFGDTLREKQVTSTPNRISVCLSDSHHNCQRQQTLFLFSFSSFVQFRLILKGLRKGLI